MALIRRKLISETAQTLVYEFTAYSRGAQVPLTLTAVEVEDHVYIEPSLVVQVRAPQKGIGSEAVERTRKNTLPPGGWTVREIRNVDALTAHVVLDSGDCTTRPYRWHQPGKCSWVPFEQLRPWRIDGANQPGARPLYQQHQIEALTLGQILGDSKVGEVLACQKQAMEAWTEFYLRVLGSVSDTFEGYDNPWQWFTENDNAVTLAATMIARQAEVMLVHTPVSLGDNWQGPFRAQALVQEISKLLVDEDCDEDWTITKVTAMLQQALVEQGGKLCWPEGLKLTR